MSPLLIAQIIAQYGPAAIGLIKDLASMWSKPTLTPEEVLAFCGRAEKSYESYLADAKK